ncbi:hypothetical protein ACFLTD_05285, partial [Elusimicrobiota bacterium]
MKILHGFDIKYFISNAIDPNKQIHDSCVDLTVKEIAHMEGKAQLDFGGSEYKPADIKPIEPKKDNNDDSHGWWELDAGYYMLKYNESLGITSSQLAIVQAHGRLAMSGVTHTTVFIEKSGDINPIEPKKDN